MAVQFNLEKSTEALSFSLEKKSVGTINPCQVHLTMDVSGSFDDEHRGGYTQALLNRFVPFAMLFDKDQKLGSFVFSNNSEELKDISKSNYDNYIQTDVMRSKIYNGGTKYCPIFKDLVSVSTSGKKNSRFLGGLFGKKQDIVVEKHLHFFITDGEAFDQEESKDVLNTLMRENDNTFFVFLSVYEHKLPFFEKYYSNTKYSTYINFTKRELMQLENLSDEDLYEMLLVPQLVNWMNK